MSIQLKIGGLDEMIDALRQVQQPSFVTTAKLEAVLKNAFAFTQANVHVDTEKLKLSGETETDFDGFVWEGTINYGSPIHDIHHAYYAIYEMSREGTKHGTPHDFFSGLEVFDAEFEDAIDSHFKVLS
jgi:hypothetical protein